MNDVVRQLVDLPSTSTKRPNVLQPESQRPHLILGLVRPSNPQAYQVFRDGAVMALIGKYFTSSNSSPATNLAHSRYAVLVISPRSKDFG
ncbi:uncharacterized protein LACBIDRAFT_314261 [Laccaria bicolor S238N-H82]|uniref:Predicted protein n=1 Tax=Laccaria bicolor (strain S238N-H82 / ATCC MYA-4686) TaxID=486041 RepID=B0D1Y2_LACBS|nr:uncharacterized protein LACBIDRAFT_314261 [Laccaria bicolor S238N-H82]EDR11720.1 predicted protein [Laccaria bicolor S238N-H82]|eukprot:XP_001877617.1 predicted protein [Laccaria bicolor S238N-H82]